MTPKCGNCGTEVDAKASQCPGCGAQFEADEGIPVPASWLGIGTGVVLVVLLGALRIVSPMLIVGIGAGIALITWILAEFLGK